ncbi:DUF29 family protein [Cylindrospermopsis raciborskii]|uniref:DUF29 family protein n=1 Tax=Cylindrospermopsis raciborskii CS-505 TaxID=533240 RepID=A0A853MEB4_9CYAN|nr:DUF29 family protein [Cylindrospermopsis raciborskii]EFA70856.1 hypothetical protein CRC_00335 [Cylindrospermopsis raciborskii CS-505]OBU77233.1 hypothetical protein A9P98_13820 [Cylindrospermopsis raciborskii CS-505]PNK16146.1 hypothetical protein CEP07_10870 [Cylindrospermopsis raciborskii S01]
MEELLELKTLLTQGKVLDALVLVEEMTEMSKDDKINKIYSFAVILILHLIKQQVEQRTTRSWDISISNAVRQINRTNKRRKVNGYYLSNSELKVALADAYYSALDGASLEAFEGRYSSEELAERIDYSRLMKDAWDLISTQQN